MQTLKHVTDASRAVLYEGPRMALSVQDVRLAATQARDLELQLREAQERVAHLSRELQTLYVERLPSLMDAVGIDHLGIAREGNLPAFELTLAEHVNANIAASWPPERRRAAFEWLDANGHGDLIATDVVVSFPREARAAALSFASQLGDRFAVDGVAVQVTVTENVHPSRLKAWLRRLLKSGKQIPPLSLIGGSLLRKAQLSQQES